MYEREEKLDLDIRTIYLGYTQVIIDLRKDYRNRKSKEVWV